MASPPTRIPGPERLSIEVGGGVGRFGFCGAPPRGSPEADILDEVLKEAGKLSKVQELYRRALFSLLPMPVALDGESQEEVTRKITM